LLSIPYNPKGQSALLSHRLVALKQFVLSRTSFFALACCIPCLPCHSTRRPIAAAKSNTSVYTVVVAVLVYRVVLRLNYDSRTQSLRS
jgi:hypothetical protein